jgi:tetratricopeptide (TPR) repeat protein
VTLAGGAAVVLPALLAVAAIVSPAHAQDGDRATMARLEQRAKAFYDLLERGDRTRAGAVWPDLERDLAGFAGSLRTRLDRMRDEVMERDGDLEELYRNPRWRDPEIQSLVATYHLAWVRYQGAQLVGDRARRQSLLKQAVDGFSQFLLVNEVPEIYAESLYGRGLAFLDLGETAKAIEDLSAASEESRVAGKARAALAEARRRGGAKQGPAENDPETLLTRLGDLLPRAAGGDATAERDATTLARGLAVRGGPWPARVESVVTDKLGERTSYGLALRAQLAVDRSRCADVSPLAEASEKVTDAGRARYRPEILFLDGGCRLNAGKAREAAGVFARLLDEFPTAARAREAAYYRFRALDVARTSDAALTGTYEHALTAYLERYPTADGAAEARFLFGELLRGRGDCDRAKAEYARIGSGPFAARARLGALECAVAQLGKDAAARVTVLAGLRELVRDTPAKGPDQKLVARAALLGAAVAAGGDQPDHAAVLELLDGFETRYPDAGALHARAVELRLLARVATGQLERANTDLDAFLRQGGDGDRRKTLVRLGRDLVRRLETLPATERERGLAMAHRIYETLVRDGGNTADRLMLADLALRAGDVPGARRIYEEIIGADGTSAEALRGAARAATTGGDRTAALGYWRRVLDISPPGGTAWYEARLAQVSLLVEDGRRSQACEVLRSSRGRATTAGADQLEKRLRAMEPDVCR